jgi:Fibronectin type III domain
MHKILTLLSILFLTLAIQYSNAQNFPIRVTPILTPPYTPFLTDYTDASSEKLTVQILLNDVTVPEYRCKLRLSIEGVNISIITNPNYVPLPIVLSGGVPQIVYGSDLSEYFKPSNLVFQGINQNEFERKGSQLPEGIYRISIEVLDYNRGTVVSNKGSATAWMILNDPPFINMPVNNSKLRPLNPQNLVFQWTPRHRGSPNAAFTTEYEVKLVEIWPSGRNPYDAINTSRPIFETTVDNTLVVYGPAETPLVLGREYALQVRAHDTGGKDLFKNNGYSEVIRFVYGDECPLPSGLFADDLGTVKARLRWQGSSQNSGYILRYREKKDGAQWFPEQTNQTLANLTQLKAGATYEYQVCGECEGFRGEYTKEQTFTTLKENPNAFVCGNPGTVPLFDNSPPLPMLFINDFINAGGFDVVVTKATGSNGRFSGEGLAVIPWFNSAKVRMTFNNVSVNKSYQLTAGDFVSVSVMDSKSLLKMDDKALTDGSKSGEGQSDKNVDAITMAGVIDSVYVNAEGKIVVIDEEGKEEIITQKKDEKTGEVRPMSITDTAGNSYSVQKDAATGETKVTKVKGGGLNPGSDPTVQTDPVKDRIIVLILELFEEEIAAWLRINGKGGEDDEDVLLALALPQAFPEEADILSHLKSNTIPYYKNQLSSIRNKIEATQSNKELLDRVAKVFNNAQSVELIKLSEEDQETLRALSAQALIDLDENLNYENSTSAETFVRGENLKYVLYFTPAGVLYALPDIAKPNFTTTNISVPPGSLTTFELDGDYFFAYYLKQNDKWQFKGYFTKTRNGKYSNSGPRMSFMTKDAIEEALETASNQVSTDPILASSVVLGIALSPTIVERIGITAAEILAKNASNTLVKLSSIASRANVISAIITVVSSAFIVYSDAYYGVGPVVPELPLMLSITEGYIDSKDVPASITTTIPISTTDFCPPEGQCSVYVIYGQYTSGEYFVAKYGMTCQKDSKPNVNPRPACQVRRLNRTLAEQILDPLGTSEGNPEEETNQLNASKRPMVLKYYSARIISGVDKTTALLIEKAMVAAYLIAKGSLPPEQGLPNFGAKTKPIQEAINNAVKYLEELTQVFK